MSARVRARADVARPGAAPDRAADLPLDRRRRDARDAMDGVCRARCCSSASSRCWCSTLMQRVQQLAAVQPAGLRRGGARSRVQHRRVVHDQHELAGLQRRIDHELLHADGRPRVPQLRVGGASASRSPSRFIRGIAQKEKDTIGNFWVDLVRGLLWVLLPICHRRRAVPRLAGRRAEPQAYDKAP